MKLAEKVINLFESDIDSIMDTLSNVEGVTPDDLIDIGLDKNKANDLVDSWWELDALERHKLTMSTIKFKKWLQDNT
jgi:hypothetical protein